MCTVYRDVGESVYMDTCSGLLCYNLRSTLCFVNVCMGVFYVGCSGSIWFYFADPDLNSFYHIEF